MANILKTYFDFAQFSMAAYADLFTDISGAAYRSALQTAGFSGVLAGQFATTNEGYAVRSVSPSNNPLAFGFSATLFEKLNDQGNGTGQFTLAIRGTDDAADILIDAVNIAILGSENLNPQYAILKEYVKGLTDPGGLLAGKTFTVTGHSLGGFLAQALATDATCASQIDKVYTYNAPGFGGPAPTSSMHWASAIHWLARCRLEKSPTLSPRTASPSLRDWDNI